MYVQLYMFHHITVFRIRKREKISLASHSHCYFNVHPPVLSCGHICISYNNNNTCVTLYLVF